MQGTYGQARYGRGCPEEPCRKEREGFDASLVGSPELWEGKGMPSEVEKIMTKGAVVEFERAIIAGTIPQYPYPDFADRYKVSIEADCAIATRHMQHGILPRGYKMDKS